MSLLDWFRRRRKKKIDEEKEVLRVHGQVATKIEKRVEKEPKRKKKKESV